MAKSESPLVLVADDEPSTLALVASHLRGRGYRVIEANDGDDAWDKACRELPDLVVLDVMMPGMSGWEVCRKIREAVSLAHTGIIMLTGIGETLNELTSPLYGADAYLDKPSQFNQLLEVVKNTLAARRDGTLMHTGPEAATAGVARSGANGRPVARPWGTEVASKGAAKAPGPKRAKARAPAGNAAAKTAKKSAAKPPKATATRKVPSARATAAQAVTKKASSTAKKAAGKAKPTAKAKAT